MDPRMNLMAAALTARERVSTYLWCKKHEQHAHSSPTHGIRFLSFSVKKKVASLLRRESKLPSKARMVHFADSLRRDDLFVMILSMIELYAVILATRPLKLAVYSICNISRDEITIF